LGTFTSEGTYDAAAKRLQGLKELGVTMVELMPLAEFPGRWNWGYDGVGFYAPPHVYGGADSLKCFVDAAHGLGLSVVLDVVYNHVGPDGNYLRAYSDDYFTDRYDTDWGEAINYESDGVREFFTRNAAFWIAEYHFDGLRLDATQNIYDSRPTESHILTEIGLRAREAAAATGRSVLLYAESEPQDAALVRAVENGGYGMDGIWIDDFHHAARVALTGRREAYFTDYRGEAQEFISSLKRGSLFQGQRYDWQNQPRGVPIADEPASSFVFYLQNHDQVANSIRGARPDAMSSPGRYRAMTAVLLLAPETPLLFMGQEFGSSKRFVFFADHVEWLASKVHAGRREFLAQFPSFASQESAAQVPDPADMKTFESCKIDHGERLTNTATFRLHADLLAIRRDDPVIAAQNRFGLDGAVLTPHAFVLRYAEGGEHRLLIVNLGVETRYNPAPEPLLAPPPEKSWKAVWSSDQARYGGPGSANPCTDKGWILPGESAVFFKTRPQKHPKRTC
jgi:maltooligosyltrehalose trehalohydrolase